MKHTELVSSIVNRLLETDISKYPTEPWGTKVNFDNVPGYDSERRDRDKEAAQYAASQKNSGFEGVVDEIMSGVDTNLNQPTASPEKKAAETRQILK